MKYCIVCLLACIFGSGSPLAADFPHRANLQATSTARGLASSRLPLLKVRTGPGVGPVVSQLLGRWGSESRSLTTVGNYATKQDKVGLQVLGDTGWTLHVRADGTSAQYRNWPWYVAHMKAVPLSQQPALSTLAAWGHKFIEENIAQLVPLGPNEELVESHATFETEGFVARDSSVPPTTSVVGATIIFSRMINGTAIVGEGSKIEIQFTVDGAPWAFSYDWPSYEASGQDQQVLPLSGIRERQTKVLNRPANVVSEAEDRFECGYVDMGFRHRDSAALLQSGCIAQQVFTVGEAAGLAADRTGALFRSGRATVIPAGAAIASDDKWHEAKALLNAGTPAKLDRASPASNTGTPSK